MKENSEINVSTYPDTPEMFIQRTFYANSFSHPITNGYISRQGRGMSLVARKRFGQVYCFLILFTTLHDQIIER